AAPLRPLPRAPPDVPRRRAGHRGAAARTRAGEAARPPPRPRFPVRSASRLAPYASRAAQTRLKSTEMATNRDQLHQCAEKHVARRKLDQALKDYLRVLDDNPKDINTLNKVGDLYVRMNRPGDSIPFYTRIADFYARDGFFLKSIAIYKKLNKIDPA